MQLGGIEVKRRVWVGLGFALVVIAGWLAWTQHTIPVEPAAAIAPKPFVRLTGAGEGTADRILRERADLLDPTPLFFPTEWNFGQRPLPARLRPQPGQVFGSFEPKFTVVEQNLKTYVGALVPAPEKLADVLTQGNEAPFAGMGHLEVSRAPLPERSGMLEVRSFGGSEPILEQQLEGFTLARPDFAPLEFIVAVSSAGVVGDPILASGSGWDEVDSFFRTYLVKTARLGERLNPGSYRVLVGP